MFDENIALRLDNLKTEDSLSDDIKVKDLERANNS